MIGNKYADKITGISSPKEVSALKKPNKKLSKDETEEDIEITTYKKRCISSKERQKIIDESRLIPKEVAYF